MEAADTLLNSISVGCGRRAAFFGLGGHDRVMKILYIDCGMGAAGDMLTAALLEASGQKEAMADKLNTLPIPGVQYVLEKSVKCGITGSHMSVLVNGEEEHEAMHAIEAAHGHHHDHDHDHDHHHDHHHDHDHDHDHHHDHDHEHEHDHHHDHDHEHEHDHHHDHEHDHGHHHHHASMHVIEHIVEDLGLPEKVQNDVLAVYQLIAEAESAVHGVPISEIHFHEVGTMDAVADVAAVCLLINEIHPDKIVASPIHVGSGTVRCAHGVLPVPAPATALILKGLPIYSKEEIKGELCTPTGAALLKHFVDEFGPMPTMSVDTIGYGMGKKDFPVANCVRILVGKSIDASAPSPAAAGQAVTVDPENTYVSERTIMIPEGKGATDVVVELSCNVDDMTAEEIGFAMERLFEGGAHEVYTQAIGMKKNRPGIKISVICPARLKPQMIELLFKYTTTIGVREMITFRNVLKRSAVELNTPYGKVIRKDVSGYGTSRRKLEFEDLARIAREKDINLREARALVEKSEEE